MVRFWCVSVRGTTGLKCFTALDSSFFLPLFVALSILVTARWTLDRVKPVSSFGYHAAGKNRAGTGRAQARRANRDCTKIDN